MLYYGNENRCYDTLSTLALVVCILAMIVLMLESTVMVDDKIRKEQTTKCVKYNKEHWIKNYPYNSTKQVGIIE